MTAYSDKLDAQLKKVEAALVQLASKHDLLTNATRTRWRWDQANVLMTWTDKGTGIGRNLQVSSVGDGKFIIELNAWKDFDDEPPRRRWKPEKLKGEYSLDDLSTQLAVAFEHVSGWSDEDLEESAPRQRGTSRTE